MVATIHQSRSTEKQALVAFAVPHTDTQFTVSLIMPDFTCVLASIFVFTGNLLLAIWAAIEKSRPTFAWDQYKTLDPDFLQDHWFDRNDLIGLHMAGSFIIAISWALLIIPLLQAAFILSNGGRRSLWLHSIMAVLAISAGTTEFVSRLMHVGSWNTANWINKDFYLDDWGGDESNPNGIGWKSLEKVKINGMMFEFITKSKKD